MITPRQIEVLHEALLNLKTCRPDDAEGTITGLLAQLGALRPLTQEQIAEVLTKPYAEQPDALAAKLATDGWNTTEERG